VRSLIARRITEDAGPRREADPQALVPRKEVVGDQERQGVNVERKIYPGYVLVEMDLNQETIHTINGIQGVIKFVGNRRLPMPLRPDEVTGCWGVEEATKEEEPAEAIPFLVGRSSRSRKGVLRFRGTVPGSACRTRARYRVSVALFEEPTSVSWITCSSRLT